MHWLTVNLCTRLVDDRNIEIPVASSFSPKVGCQCPTMLDSCCPRRKIHPFSVAKWNAVFFVEVVGSHFCQTRIEAPPTPYREEPHLL